MRLRGRAPVGHRPFVLAEGASSLDAEAATLSAEPFACTWLWHEDRTPAVRFVVNEGYWNRRRGPRVREVELRDALAPRACSRSSARRRARSTC